MVKQRRRKEHVRRLRLQQQNILKTHKVPAHKPSTSPSWSVLHAPAAAVPE